MIAYNLKKIIDLLKVSKYTYRKTYSQYFTKFVVAFGGFFEFAINLEGTYTETIPILCSFGLEPSISSFISGLS